MVAVLSTEFDATVSLEQTFMKPVGKRKKVYRSVHTGCTAPSAAQQKGERRPFTVFRAPSGGHLHGCTERR